MGRDHELEMLDAALDAAAEGRGRLLLCAGEAGIGKTRLAEEAARRAGVRSMPVGFARAGELDGSPPYWLWHQVLDDLGVDAGTVRRSAADGTVDPPPEVDPAQERFGWFTAVTDALAEVGTGRGLLVVLDDIHHADEPSLLLLTHLAHRLDDLPILVMTTQRQGAAEPGGPQRAMLDALVAQRTTEVLELPGLELDDVATMLSDAGVEPEVMDPGTLWWRTSGNAFLVREMVRAARNGAVDLEVPGPVVDVTRHRLRALDPEAQLLLRSASVLGPQFSVGVLAAMRRVPALDLLGPIDAAVDGGFLAATGLPGSYRFSHDLVRAAIEGELPLVEQVRLHAAAADAIEGLYEGRLRPHLAELARHRRISSLPGDRGRAVSAARAAAVVAHEELAFEEAIRLFLSALELAADELDDRAVLELLLGLAGSRHAAGDFQGWQATLAQAAQLPVVRHEPAELARVVLAAEPVGERDWDRLVREVSSEVVAALPEGDVRAVRALARLAQADAYLVDEAGADRHSASALELARSCADPAALVDALHARQLACSGPAGHAERAVLADELLEVARRLRNLDAERWARLWRIDVLQEDGELGAVAAELDRLAPVLERIPGPVARWHLLTTRAALAQSEGRYEDALADARTAFGLLFEIGHTGAFGAFASLATTVGRHIGHDRTDSAAIAAGPPGVAMPVDDPRISVFPELSRALVAAETGRRDLAEAAAARLAPLPTWHVVPALRIPAWTLAALLAAEVGDRDLAGDATDRLRPYADRWACGGAGQGNNLGPIHLHLGRTTMLLGDPRRAHDHLRAAVAAADGAGAPGYSVEARVVLAELASDAGVDRSGAVALLDEAEPVAARLGMAPFRRRIAAARQALDRPRLTGPDPSPLSRREQEVAALVAAGRTNAEIAEELYVSQRTAQNHVQHILTKLGFSRRSQIAAWYVSRLGPVPAPANE